MCDNLLLFLFIWDISGHVSKSYYFQRVRATHNIMHVSLTWRYCQIPKKSWPFPKPISLDIKGSFVITLVKI